MPLPVIADTYRVALNWANGSQHAVNVMHFRALSSSASAVASAVDANVTAAMWGAAGSATAVNRLDVTPLNGSGATYSLAVSGAKWAGGSGVGDFVPAAAHIVKLSTTLRGRSNRGRIYIPFPLEAVISNGTWTGSLTTMQTAWSTFLTNMTNAGVVPVVASYLHATSQTVTSFLPETVLGTQRRRQSRLRA